MYRSEQHNYQMNELMFQAGVDLKGMSERSELIPCTINIFILLYISTILLFSMEIAHE